MIVPNASDSGRNVVLFAPDVTDVSTIKRVQEFSDRGYIVTVFGFRRSRYNRDYRPPWPHVLLGFTEDRQYGRRVRSLLAAVPKLLANRKRFRQADVFYARNIDQLLLALLARALSGRRAPLVYEVLDIPAILVGRGVTSMMLRAIERACLRRIKLLVLSSAGFQRNYYFPVQGYAAPWFLLENKLHRTALDFTIPRVNGGANRERRRGARSYKWVVGYFGLIRGEETFALITRLAERLRGEVAFRFRGVLTTVDDERFLAALRHYENISYDGDYRNPQDLSELYGDVDFAWAIDLEHTAHNSRWLLPCRFYEAGLFGVPCLTVQDFEIGDLVERLNVGWAFAQPLEEELVRFFRNLTRDEYTAKRERLALLPRATFVADGEFDTLCHLMTEATPSALAGSGASRAVGVEDVGAD